MRKLGFVTGVAVGYVFGTKAGRKRYEQIKNVADKVWNSKIVAKPVDKVSGAVRKEVNRRGEQITDKVAETIKDRLFNREPARHHGDYVEVEVIAESPGN